MSKYEGLRRRLAELAEVFDEAAESFLPLHHQLLLCVDDVTPDDWRSFVETNRRPGGDWQHFEVVAGGRRCSRFSGFDEGIDEYTRLAGEGYDLLAAIRRLADDSQELPPGFVLTLPEPAGLHGWNEAVYSTAGSYATARLFERQGDWDRTGLTVLSEDERWVATGAGDRRLAHPAYRALGHDVFTSSAEAIRLWLDPGSAVRVGWDNERPEIVLPGPAIQAGDGDQRPQPVPSPDDRPVWDAEQNELRVGPVVIKRYKVRAKNQWLILAAFEECDWQPRIDDPLPPSRHLGDPSKRMRDTIRTLNRRHKTPGVILFEADGKGEGIVCRRLGPGAG